MVVFADAGDTFEASEFVIFGSPGDRTSSFRRGSRLAPLAIRMASYNFETFDPDTGTDLDDIAVHDAGDVTPEADTIEEMTLRVLRAGKIPLILGGEHTLTIGACRAHDLDVVYIDAHADFRDEYLGERICHATVARRLSEAGHRIVHIGLRSISRDEYPAFERSVTSFSGDLSVDELDDALSTRQIYLTLDMDAIDPAEAPGVANPEPCGIPSAKVRNIITHLASRIAGMDVVEVCPPYDDGTTALLAAYLVRHAIHRIAAADRR